jgi:hypothetical protein
MAVAIGLSITVAAWWIAPAVSPAAAGPVGSGFVAADEFSRRAFPHVPRVDNPWLPLVPGVQLVLTGQATHGGSLVAHQVVATVTSLVKEIDGVATVVLFDRDFSEGQLVEAELAFQAQDRRGTVWSLGEYPEEYEDGVLQGAPSAWLSGVQRAHAGILLQAHPRVGTPIYSQGFAPRIEFGDQARVKDAGRHICLPAGCFDNVLVIDESDAFDPAGGHQLKFHAPGLGVVQVRPRGDVDEETLVLTKVQHLSRAELRRVDTRALQLDRRAQRIAPQVFCCTSPAHPG